MKYHALVAYNRMMFHKIIAVCLRFKDSDYVIFYLNGCVFSCGWFQESQDLDLNLLFLMSYVRVVNEYVNYLAVAVTVSTDSRPLGTHRVPSRSCPVHSVLQPQ